MIDISTSLRHYKREDIQKEMIEHAKDKEVIARFNDKFSNRPDVLKYERDILELAKQGATSFHASEEIWENPLRLDPNMRKKELEKLRTGWDLVIDIDCPYWEYSKLITHLIIKALKKHDVSSVSCKFSGNKGFHIGVPFEAFPKNVSGREIKSEFPDGVRVIASYLIDRVGFDFTKEVLKYKSIEEVERETEKRKEELEKDACVKCGTFLQIKKEKARYYFGCAKCGNIEESETSFNIIKCSVCGSLTKRTAADSSSGVTRDKRGIIKGLERKPICKKCGSKSFEKKADLSLILNIDSILISSRHLYRMPYSLHEKTGLCSIPINPDRVLEFEKEMAKSENARVDFKFIDKKNVVKENAKRLFDDAFYWHYENIKGDERLREELKEHKIRYEVKSALSEHFFPPCIKNILKGLEDGRKRSVFILINFLTSVGWDHEKIEKLIREWNKKNSEELREVNFLGQLRYHKQQNKKMLPPNCDNRMYFKDMGVCTPDNLCSKVKNPVNYSIRKVRHIK